MSLMLLWLGWSVFSAARVTVAHRHVLRNRGWLGSWTWQRLELKKKNGGTLSVAARMLVVIQLVSVSVSASVSCCPGMMMML